MVGSGSFCGDWEVVALVMDFKEVRLTSPSELAHWGEGGSNHTSLIDFYHGLNVSWAMFITPPFKAVTHSPYQNQTSTNMSAIQSLAAVVEQYMS